MFLRANFQLVLLFVFHTSAVFVRFTLPRVNYRLKDASASEVRCSSSITCCALCKVKDGCLTVSYKSSESRCLLGTDRVTHDGRAVRYLETDPGWVTMSKVVYTVYQRKSPAGTYKATFTDAVSLCAEHGTVLASPEDLLESRARGLEVCACAWLSDGTNGFVLQKANSACWGRFSINILYCGLGKANVWCKF